ncbi:MAG: tetratricopeptide repeat protein [Candidatus Aminicenantes bacterium]|nr:tetratricopeptide repeat protein [Candidatus Aminicenantes bacterium]
MRYGRFFLCLMLGFLLICLSSGFAQEDYTRDEYRLAQDYKVANSMFVKGKEFFDEKKFQKAEKEFLKCLGKMPEHADASFYLAQVYYNLKDLAKALEYIKQAAVNYHHIAKIKLNMQQQLLLKLQEEKEDLEEYVRALRDALASTTDPREREKVQNQISKRENRINIIDSRMREPHPELEKEEHIPADYYYFHGNILFKLKNYQEAFEQYQKAITIDPSHGNAYNNLANLYYMARRYKEALECLEKAEKNGVEVNPDLRKAVLKALDKLP